MRYQYSYLLLGIFALNMTCDSYARSHITSFTKMYDDNNYTKPYVGIEYKKISNLKPYEDWQLILPKKFDGFTLFLGERFTKHLGMEIGYARFFSKSKNTYLTTQNYFFGTRFLENFVNNAKVAINSYQLDFNLYQPLAKHASIGCSIGAANTKAKLRILERSGPINNLASVYAKNKIIPRAGIFTELTNGPYGLRLGFRWENTERLRLKPGRALTSFPNMSLKYFGANINFNVGGFIRFL